MKETTTKNLMLLAVLGLGLLGVSANAQFSDNFEGPSLNPFWSTALQSGYVVCPSSTRAHSGSYSLELVTTATVQDKNASVHGSTSGSMPSAATRGSAALRTHRTISASPASSTVPPALRTDSAPVLQTWCRVPSPSVAPRPESRRSCPVRIGRGGD